MAGYFAVKLTIYIGEIKHLKLIFSVRRDDWILDNDFHELHTNIFDDHVRYHKNDLRNNYSI